MSTVDSLHFIVAVRSPATMIDGFYAFRSILQQWVDVVGGFDDRGGEGEIFQADNEISLLISIRLLIYS